MSNQITPHKKIDLPAFEDLLKDPEEAFKNDQFNALVNQEPPVKWLKPHPTAKNRKGEPIKYITIEKVEFLLTKIFGDWHPDPSYESVIWVGVALSVIVCLAGTGIKIWNFGL